VNFGIVYGQSAFGLSRQLNIDQKEAERFIEAYFARYPGVEQFLNKVLADCRANGYVSTILGRRRAISGIRPGTRRQRNPPERTAINTVIQGSAADLIKEAMLAVHRRLRREKLSARLLLQIHDELVFEVPQQDAEAVGRLVTEEMSAVLSLRVPIKVDIKSGRTLAEV
jgi:DNA polymerase-1